MGEKPAFTDRGLKALESGGKWLEIRDPKTAGLVLRVTPKGSKRWAWDRRIVGRHERIAIGEFPEVSISKAREAAHRLNGKLVAGKNPAEIRRELKAQLTIGELWERYLRLHAKPNKRSWRMDELQYTKHLKEWEHRRLSSITRSDVKRLHSRIAAKKNPDGGPIAANRVVALLSSMWGWSNRGDGLELPNPCIGVKRSPERARDRYLDAGELRSFIRTVREWPDADMRDAVLLLLFTGQRKGNVLGMRWSDLDLRHRLWTIPPSSSKSGRQLVVPLVAEVVEILQRRRSVAVDRVLTITPNRFRGQWEKLLKACEIKRRLTPHDLRRTIATWMRAQGADFALVGDALGHANPSVTSVYALPVVDLVRGALKRAVEHMLNVADAEEGTVVPFPAVAR